MFHKIDNRMNMNLLRTWLLGLVVLIALIAVVYVYVSEQETVEETSAVIKERVTKARQMQTERFKNTKIHNNSSMNSAMVKNIANLIVKVNKCYKMLLKNLNLQLEHMTEF